MASTKNRGLLKKWTSKYAWGWRFLRSHVFTFKNINFKLSFLDDILFKFVSVFEAIALVSVLCLFFLCCGCHF